MLYLFTNSEPYAGLPYEKISEECRKVKNVAVDLLDKAPNLPPSLLSFVKECINPDPTKRSGSGGLSPFNMILKMQKPFERILSDYLDMTRGEAINAWNSPNNVITFQEFCAGWGFQFGVALNPQQQMMLRALMEVKMDEKDAIATVKKDKFEQLLTWFGPVKKATLSEVWSFMTTLLSKCKWFHGAIDAGEAKNRLRAKNGDKNYLVRLNTGVGEDKSDPFILVYRKDNKTFDVGFKPKFSVDPALEIKGVLDRKKIADFLVCDNSRSTNFDRPFDTGNKAHVGSGYTTDNTVTVPLDIDD